MTEAPLIPGLGPQGMWDIPARLNMARQCLSGPSDSLAIIDLTGAGRQDVSVGALSEMADALARRLLRDVRQGDRVGVLLGQSPWCAAAHLAIWKIGAISVPLFKLFKHDALQSRIGDAGVRLVLTDVEGRALLGDLATSLLVADIGEDGGRVEFAETGPDDPAILIYTSGTTGRPKGVVMSNSNLMITARNARR